ncbi:MAG: hypothetical protein WAP51_02215 [Candidatus Sungiibacteriota bacterium]
MAELIHQFGIDWRLLVAQAVNFFILFFVLWRFAYRPVLAILAERRKKIEEGLNMREEAERKLAEAGRSGEAIVKKAGEVSLQLVNKGESLGKEKAIQVIEAAMKKEEELINEGKMRAEEERRILHEVFSKEAAQLVRMAAARVVERSPDAIDGQLVKEALAELKSAPASNK